MKAWEIAKKIVDDAPAKLVYEKEEDWTMSDLQSGENNTLRNIWRSKAPGSGAPASLVAGAVQSVGNMGRDITKAENLLRQGLKARDEDDIIALHRLTHQLFTELNEAPIDKTSTYWQYDQYKDFETFAKACNFPKTVEVDITTQAFRQRTHKSWMAQIAAGAFGTAIEGYSRERIKETFGVITTYLKPPSLYNDDITYELAFLLAVRDQKRIPTSFEIATEWVSRIPFGWSAEDIALKNLRLGIMPPQSGEQNNPYREWIGAQMRGAVCGNIAPGNPYLAAKLAWIDGQISHANNGIIGEVFNAVLVAMAYVETDMRVLLERVIEMLPVKSEYYHIVKSTLEQCKKADNYEEVLIWCEEAFKEYNLVHAYPNAAIQVVALWFGQDDFDLNMQIAAIAGLDVDCNTAQLGAIVGMMASSHLSDEWTQPIGDELKTYVRGVETLPIAALVDWTIEAAKIINE